MAVARLFLIAFVVLTVIYVSLSFYSRAGRKGKLRTEWAEGDKEVDEDTFVDAGLREYEGSLRRKLIWGVYVVPMVVILLIVYLTNYA